MGSMIFLALVIVLVSGLIAYVGDLVGRKMGRKRLTLMGLRPRHTAIVISVTSGMLIAILTLIATLIVNRGVREAFFTPLDKLKTELVTQREAVLRTKGELTAARLQTTQAHGQLAVQQGNLQKLNAQLATTNAYLASSQQRRATVERQLKDKQAELTRTNKELARVQRQHTDVSRQLAVSQRELKALEDDLAELQRQVAAGETSLRTVTDEIRKSEDYKRALEDSLARMSEQIDVLTEFARGSFSPLSFTNGQEILTGLLPAKLNATERKRFVTDFLAVADPIVHQRSVELPKDAVGLVFLTGAKESLAHITREEAATILTARLEKITAPTGIIIRLAPINNVPINGPALIDVDRIELIPNAPAYTAGSVIARVDVQVTSQTTMAEILGALADDLLREKVPSALRAKGILSSNRRFDSTHPKIIPEPVISTVSWADLIAAAEKVRACQGKVSLVAYTHTPVTLYGPVDIDIDVVPAQ